MLENKSRVPIDSDVLIAPHHGSKGSGSTEFISEVSPEWVIFSAGRGHDHPHGVAAKRYLAVNPAINMLRTDRYDDEGEREWDCGRIARHKDRPGDDDVDVAVSAAGELTVAYRKETAESLPRCLGH